MSDHFAPLIVTPPTQRLHRNCANCAHFDDDCHCAHLRPLVEFIKEPTRVVCDQHEPKE